MPERKTKPKRVRDFLKVAPKDRRNPQQIRRFFFDTVKEDFGRSLDAAADELLAGVPRDEQRAYHRRSLANTLYRITRDEIAINYSHLELLARYHGIPTGLMLVFTRLQSELADRRGGGIERARTAARSIEAALRVIREALGDERPKGRGAVLGRAVLKQVTHAYQTALAPEQPQLDLEMTQRPRGDNA